MECDHNGDPMSEVCKQTVECDTPNGNNDNDNEHNEPPCDKDSRDVQNVIPPSSDSDAEVVDDVLLNGCFSASCAYGGGRPGNYLDIYKCRKCKGFYMCTQCKSEGGHQKHSKYIEFDSHANIK